MVYLFTVSFNMIQVTSLNCCQSCCLLEVTHSQANEARKPSVGNNALTHGKLQVSNSRKQQITAEIMQTYGLKNLQ